VVFNFILLSANSGTDSGKVLHILITLQHKILNHQEVQKLGTS